MSVDHVEKVEFRISDDLAQHLAARVDAHGGVASVHLAARLALERYFNLLHDALPFVTRAEARWIVAAHWATFTGDGLIAARMLPLALRDYAADPEGATLARAWGVDPAHLAARAQEWSPTARLAVIDAIERLRALMTRPQAADAGDDDAGNLDALIIAVWPHLDR